MGAYDSHQELTGELGSDSTWAPQGNHKSTVQAYVYDNILFLSNRKQ
jgi:hypothetical protein